MFSFSDFAARHRYAARHPTSDASRGLAREEKTLHALATRSAYPAPSISGILKIPTLQGLEVDISPCAR